ncbi:MAG: hypothetical protein ABSG86_10800 [Thermoguttaceae bacterium]|jgi:hypothetical protein
MERIKLLVAVAAFWNCSLAARAEAQQAGDSGASLENQSLRVTAAPGQPTVVLHFKSAGIAKRAEIAIQGPGAAHSPPISKAEVVEDEAGQGVLRVTAGVAQAEITLGAGVFVKVNPGKNAASVEVRAGARYVALPDFFADDVVFDPVRFAAATLSVPAENFLLQFIEGGDSIVMCIWPGNLKLPARGSDMASGRKVVREGPDPEVDLVFAGAGKARRVSAARIEFQNKPVYVGILEHKGIWHDQDAGGLPAYAPATIAWKRPFEAKWRGDFIVAEGKRLEDWPTRSQSFEFQSTSSPRTDRWWERGTDALDARFAAATSNPRPEKWWERGDENAPQIWQESLASFFIYPAVLKGDEVRLCLYADKAARNRQRRSKPEVAKAGRNAPDATPPNVYERVIIYPLGRVPATPLTVFTPVDLMRETLGTGPCQYVLDLAGVKPQPAGGDRPILSYATCGLWNDHIAPITRQFKKLPGGGFEPLDEKTKAHLIQAVEEMWYFVHAVHDRLREYRQWGAGMAAFCQRESARSPAVRPLAEKAMLHIQRLNADIGRHRFEGPGSEAYWKDRIPELIALVKQDQYVEVAGIAGIRDLGNQQDERVSRCRQYVKALRQEILLQDTGDAEARSFAAEIRDRCRQMLRNMHPKEGF